MGKTLSYFKRFFQRVGGIIFPASPTDDIGVAETRRLYLDADQAVPNNFIRCPGGAQIEIRPGDTNAFNVQYAVCVISGRIHPSADNVRDIGDATHRYLDCYSSREIGIHDGSNFTDSLTAAGLKLAGRAAIVDADGTHLILGDTTIAIGDDGQDLGQSGRRWRNIIAGTEVGYDGGGGFVNSFDNVGVKIGGLQAAVIHSGDFIEAGVDGTHAFMLPNMTTEERNALSAVNGMIIYETTVGEIQARVGGAWVKVSTEGAGS